MATPRKSVPLGLGFAVIGSELATVTLIGVALDYVIGTGGGFSVGFALLGMVLAVLLTIRLLRAEELSRKSQP